MFSYLAPFLETGQEVTLCNNYFAHHCEFPKSLPSFHKEVSFLEADRLAFAQYMTKNFFQKDEFEGTGTLSITKKSFASRIRRQEEKPLVQHFTHAAVTQKLFDNSVDSVSRTRNHFHLTSGTLYMKNGNILDPTHKPLMPARVFTQKHGEILENTSAAIKQKYTTTRPEIASIFTEQTGSSLQIESSSEIPSIFTERGGAVFDTQSSISVDSIIHTLLHEQIEPFHYTLPKVSAVSSNPTVSSTSAVLKAYTIGVHLPAYAMRINGDCYFFDAVTTSFRVKINGECGKIGGPPSVSAQAIYAHPFVYPKNTICYDQGKRWEENDVHFEKKEFKTTKDRVRFAKKMGYVAAESARTLRQGYREAVVPVSNISYFTEKRRSEKDLLEKGVLIYENC